MTHLPELRDFVDEWIATVDPSPTAIVVAHAPPSGGYSVLHTEGVGTKKKARAAELAARFADAAQAHATATGGLQRYSIAAKAGVEVLGQRLFTIETVRAGGIGDLEIDGSAAAIVKTVVRQTERAYKLLADDRESAMRIMQAQLAQYGQHELEGRKFNFDQQIQVLKLIQDLTDRKHDRDLELEQARKKEDRTDKLLEGAMGAWPIVIAHLTGATPLNQLVSTLTTEQREALMTILSDEGRAQLRQIFELGQASDEGAKKLLAAIAPSPTTERSAPG